jgi:DNA polymerase III delta subunit
MILTLTGADDYRREKRKRHLIEEFKKKYSANGIERFSAATKDGRDKFHEAVFSPSLFSAKRLAVLDDVFEADEKDKRFIADLKQAIKDETLWVFISERDKVLVAWKFLTQKPITHEDFPFLAGEEWRQFVAHEAKARNLSLQAEALRLLVTVYEGDTWRLVTELDRLASKGGVIRAEDIDALDAESSINLWGILTQLRGPSLPKRIQALEKIFRSQEPAAKIFNIMAAQAGTMTKQFAQWDVMIKSGKLEYEEVLLEYVLN